MALIEGPALDGRAEPDLERIRRDLAAAGPGAADVLRALVHGASTLLDAPARLAMLRSGRLEWVLAQDDDGLVAGTPVATNGSPCGDSWRDGEARLLGEDGRPAPCLGTPPAALVVPVVLSTPGGGGRRAAGRPEVCALLALVGPRAGWFSLADLTTCVELAEVAAGRLARLINGPKPVRPQPVTTVPAQVRRPEATPAEGTPVQHESELPASAGSARGWFDSDPAEAPPTPPRGAAPSAPPTRPVPKLLPTRATPARATPPRPAPSRTPSEQRPVDHPPIDLRTVPTAEPDAVDPTATRVLDLPPAFVGRPVAAPTRTLVREAPPAVMPALPAADSMGLWQWDATTGECRWSTPVARLLGLPLTADLTLDLVRQVVDEADQPRFDIAVRAIASGRGVAGALRLNGRDGSTRQAYAWSEVRRADDGTLLGAWGGVVDVTAFERDAVTQRTAVAGLRAAQELAGVATWEWRPDTGELLWSDEMYRLIGVSAQDVEPSLEFWHSFVHPEDLTRARRLDTDADGEGERVETFRLIGPGGAIRHVQSWSAAGPVEGTGPAAGRRVYGATIDVTRQVQDRITVERLTATDPVTGLANRAAFEKRLAEATTRPGPPVTLLLLDLDRFRTVNDGLGHQVGDRLLIEVARRLGAVVPDGSYLARPGGDEFAVLLPRGAGESDVLRLAERLVEALKAPYQLPETGETLMVAASVGIARSEGRPLPGHELLREADIALYRAKDAGRGRFVVFDAALREATEVRTRVERRLRAALAEGRLMARYQPVVDFVHGRIVGAEAKARVRDLETFDREDPMLPPEIFREVAERTGLVVEIDAWLVEQAIGQIVSWGEHTGEAGESPWLSLNVSARSLEHPGVTRRLVDVVQRGDIGRDRIRLEIAEHDVVAAAPGLEAAVRQLTAAGIAVGITGFGTGYAAVAYLQQIRPDFVKVAPGFTAAVGENPRADAVVSAVVELAHAYRMKVVADGVESGRQARRLRELGCDLAQGHHFGRPGDPARIVRS
ncbi:EAL domain-containing protein [Spongisporangium articulatum]|uniref:EAL domain-containing protein n=1 Tax=Spongisporangium articulatum TaxID=3362603 RepID=A0ABW8AH71_9ACTN